MAGRTPRLIPPCQLASIPDYKPPTALQCPKQTPPRQAVHVPCSTMRFAAAWQARKTPLRLMLMTASKSASDISRKGAERTMPVAYVGYGRVDSWGS